MKKRILSLLLLVALLVTGIPMVAVSAEETPVYTNEDYAELYAKQNNLVHLYMAFNNGNAADYYDMANRKWFDMIGDKDATFTNYTVTEDSVTRAVARWTADAKGGISISIPNETTGANNKIDFGVAALKDASGNWYESYTVDASMKIVHRQLAIPYKTYDAAALAAVKTTDGTDTLYNLPVEKVTTSARTYITFTREDTSSALVVQFYWGDKTTGGSEYKFTFSAGSGSATVNLPLTGSAVGIRIKTAGVSISEVRRPISSGLVKAQLNSAFAYGHMFVLHWANLPGFNPEATEVDGKGNARFASGANSKATWGTGSCASSVYHPGAHVDTYVPFDAKAVSTTMVKTVNNAKDKDVWGIYVGGKIVSEGIAAAGVSNGSTYAGAASAAGFYLMSQEQGSVYAVRVYNAALTKEEADWNHFVDILAYIGYDIAKLNGLSEAAKRAVAATFAGYSVDAVTAVNVDIAVQGVAFDYSDWYIDEAVSGAELIGLYTAFLGEAENTAADIAAAKWTNKVASGDDIVLKKTSSMYWTVAFGGGMLANGVNKDTCLYVNNVRMELPDAWAALPDFTVESAQILHGVTDCASMPQPSGKYHMRIDLLRFHHTAHITNSDNLGGGGTWHANFSGSWWDRGRDKVWRAIYEDNGKAAGGDTLWVNKSTAADGSVTYTTGHSYYALNRFDGAEQQPVNGATYTKAQYDAAVSNRDFYMFSGMAVEVYAIRVYNGALTENEKAYNHLIDLLAFYQVEIPAGVSREWLMLLAPAYTQTTMVLDRNGAGDDYDTIKADLTAKLEEQAPLRTVYDELYTAKDNLIGLYTAFGTLTGVYGDKWQNKAANGHLDATLYLDASKYVTAANVTDVAWRTANAKGGLTLGINSKEDWVGIGEKAASIRLDESWASLPNFTVETSSVAVGAHMPSNKYASDKVTITSTTGGETINTPGGPTFGETFCLDMISSVCFFNLYANNGLGMGMITRMEKVSTTPWYAVEGRTEAYRSLMKAVNPGSSDSDFGTIPAGLTLVYTKNTTDTSVIFGATASTGTAINIDGGSAFAGSYTYTKEAYTSAVSGATITNGHKFALYNRGMYDVYAIRVYDKVLNETEKQYNHLIDLLAFYEVAIPAGVGEAQLAIIAAKYAATVFVYSNEGNGNYKHDTIKNNLTRDVQMLGPATKTEYDELYAAKENLIALYSAFGIDSSVFIEGSTWKNKVEGKADATLYDNHSAIDFALGENGGIAITGVLYGHYNGDLPKNFGIKLSESYMDLSAFTVESVSILESLEYMKNGEPDPIDNCGDWQHFRYGALSCDLWLNKFSADYHLQMNWRNIPAEGQYWQGTRDSTLRNGYDSYGMYVGFTQSVSMKTEADESKTYSLYYGAVNEKFDGTRGKANISKEQYEATLAAETKKLGSFYMFAGTPGEVYAIRVYDKVLNESERLQNFMVDLLAFYEIDIATLDVSALAAMGAKHGTMVFTHDETLYAENKATLQAEVDFMTMTVSENVETKVVVKDDASYAAVRFMASIDRAIADKYVVKSYGILITPKAYVDAAGAFTADALEAYLKAEGVENYGSAESRAYLNVVADDFYAASEEAYTIAGGFTNFSIKTKEGNPAFAAVAYAVVEVNGKDVVVYGSYNEDACITVKETLTAAREAIYLENAADPRLSVYDEVLAQFN